MYVGQKHGSAAVGVEPEFDDRNGGILYLHLPIGHEPVTGSAILHSAVFGELRSSQRKKFLLGSVQDGHR